MMVVIGNYEDRLDGKEQLIVQQELLMLGHKMENRESEG